MAVKWQVVPLSFSKDDLDELDLLRQHVRPDLSLSEFTLFLIWSGYYSLVPSAEKKLGGVL